MAFVKLAVIVLLAGGLLATVLIVVDRVGQNRRCKKFMSRHPKLAKRLVCWQERTEQAKARRLNNKEK